MLGIGEIMAKEKSLVTDRAIYFGVAGAIGGYLVANQMQLSPPMTIASIGLGHFAGHSADQFL